MLRVNPRAHAQTPAKIFTVFQTLGLDAMVQAYRSNMRISSYRWKQYLWQVITGVRFLHFLERFNAGVKELAYTPMAQSAWNILQSLDFPLSIDWRINRERLKGFPIIFYARHPGYIEPMACLAALKEFNPKAVATAWIANISKSVSERIIAVPDSQEATLSDLRKYKGIRRILETIWAQILTFQVIRHLQGDMSAAECKRQRRLAVVQFLNALGNRESVLLFPSGGEGQKPWAGEHPVYFEKLIRTVISSQKKTPALNDLLFVPLITRNYIRSLFKSQVMMPWNPAGFLFRLLPVRPFQLIVREQVCLRDLLQQEKGAGEIVEYLMNRLVP